MLHRPVFQSRENSNQTYQKRNCSHKPPSRHVCAKENIAPRKRMTHDVGLSNQQKQQENFKKCKEVVLKERSASIKAYHLKIKDQDDMIKEMRKKVVENKSLEKSLVNSRCSGFNSEGSQEFLNISKKLSALEKNICSKKRLQRSSSRTRYLLSKTQQNTNLYKPKEATLTPMQQLTIVKFPDGISSQILKVDSDVKKLLELIQDLQKQHQTIREDHSLTQQTIQTAISKLADLQIDKQRQAQSLEQANQRYRQVQQNIQAIVERQRKKYMMGKTCFYKDMMNPRVSM